MKYHRVNRPILALYVLLFVMFLDLIVLKVDAIKYIFMYISYLPFLSISYTFLGNAPISIFCLLYAKCYKNMQHF